MIRHRKLDHRFVGEIPDKLDPGLLYISMQYATAVHLCCCGCGHEVVTPLSPAQWRMTFDGESVSLHPSIGSWSLRCRSHYVLRNGQVIEAGQWTDKDVAAGQVHDKQARTAHYAAKTVAPDAHRSPAQDQPNKGWLAQVREFISDFMSRDP